MRYAKDSWGTNGLPDACSDCGCDQEGTKIGDTFGLPPEPPVGAELKVVDGDGNRFTIRHVEDGWYIVGTHTRVRWETAFRTWVAEPGTVATVVRMP